VTFAFLGFLLFFSAEKLKTTVFEYGADCQGERSCQIGFVAQEDLKRPNLYYELDPFFTNYRKVITTANLFQQLGGKSIDPTQCQGVSHVKDLVSDLSVYARFARVDLKRLDPETALSPCGILPKYVFTDSFELWSADKKAKVVIDETNIARPYDREYVYKKDESTVQWLDVTNGKWT